MVIRNVCQVSDGARRCALSSHCAVMASIVAGWLLEGRRSRTVISSCPSTRNSLKPSCGKTRPLKSAGVAPALYRAPLCGCMPRPRAAIGWFEAGEVVQFSAARVPRQVRTDAHVTPADLREYLRGASMGYGIPVVRCKRLRRPVHLPDGQRGPMSYRYLTTGDARLIRALRNAA